MAKNGQNEMGFLEHLEELRKRIIKSIIAVIFGSIISFNYINQILHILLQPTFNTSNPINLISLKVQGMFIVKWSLAIIVGCIIVLPFLIYQFWKFIAPGLKVNEKKFALPIVFFSFTSFLSGVLFGYFIIVPFSLEFFSNISSGYVENNFSIQYYLSFLTWLLLGTGLIFQLPVVSFILSIIGVLTPAFMRHYRRHAIVAIFIISSFITPPDPLSMLIMSCPLAILYELSIFVSWLVGKKKKPN